MYEQTLPTIYTILRNLRVQRDKKLITHDDYEKRMDEIFRVANESKAVEHRVR